MDDMHDREHPGWVTFLGQWVRNPKSTASLIPSGHQLARMMAAAVPNDAKTVVEIGAGTGAITDALLTRRRSNSLLVVEMNRVMSEHLRRRFPGTSVVCEDARRLVSVVDATEGFHRGAVDAVVSSLGLLSMSPALQREIFEAAFAVVRPAGVLVQYTYGPRPPLNDRVREGMGLEVHGAGRAWRNFPPARVYLYSQAHPHPLPP